MFGRKKKDKAAADVPTVAPGQVWVPMPANDGEAGDLERLRSAVPGMMDALRRGETARTVVTTSITENGQTVDPNSDEGRKLMAMLDGMGIVLPNPTAGTPAPPMPAPAPMTAPDLPVVDQAAVSMALQQAQSDPQKLPQIVALVDDYVHGRVDHDAFEAGRRRIVGY